MSVEAPSVDGGKLGRFGYGIRLAPSDPRLLDDHSPLRSPFAFAALPNPPSACAASQVNAA